MLLSSITVGAAAQETQETVENDAFTITFDVVLPDGITADASILVQGGNGEEYSAEADGTSFLLSDGDYMYTVRAEGCITEMGILTVNGADATKSVNLEATPPTDMQLSRLGQDHSNGKNNNAAGRDMEVEGSGYVGWIRTTAWIKYANVNLLGGLDQYEINYAIDGSGSCNLGFDLRVANAGSAFADAVSVGSLKLTERTGGWGKPGKTAVQTEISQEVNTVGVHDVYAVFTDGEYNFGYINLSLKPETGEVKSSDLSFKVKPYDAQVVVTDLQGNVCDPLEEGGKSYHLEEGFYKYTVSKEGYTAKSAILPVDISKTIQVILLDENATTYTRYEAEAGEITGANIVEDAGCSGGQKVGGFGQSTSLGNINGTFSNISNIKFTVEAEDTGIAEIVIGYNSSVNNGAQDRIAVKSSDGTIKEVYLNETGKSTVFVDVRGAENTIYVSNVLSPRVSNDGNAWIDIDYIEVNNTLTSGSVEAGDLDEPYEQPKNPIVKSIFTADPEAHVWPSDPNTLYLYPSHDVDPPAGCDRMDVYHVYSTQNMVDFVDEGEILRADDLDWNREEKGFMWAPDAAYKDGYYYFYWPTPTGTNWGATWQTGVMRSRYPDRGFEQITDNGFKGYIEGAGGDGMIDVCVRVFDGQPYIYIGGSQRFFQGKLKDDMITLDGPLTQVDTKDILPAYHEGPSVFKRGDLYYLIYPGGGAAESGFSGDKFNYCTSTNPLGPWQYRGYFLNPTGCDTSHGSVVEFKDKWYVFYHTMDLSGNGTLRSVNVDEITFNDDGTIQLMSKTSDSVAQNGPDYVRPTGTVYTASDAVLGGGAAVIKDLKANNGEVITDMNLSGAFAQFENVDGGNGGRASLVIHYSTPDTLPKVKLWVNGFDYSFINLPSTGGRSFFTGEATFTIKELQAGATNTIKLDGGHSKANIDYIEIIPFNDDNTPQPVVYTLGVTGGTIAAGGTSGVYEAGETVTVTASAPAPGYAFKGWTAIGLTDVDLTAQSLTFTMPAKDVILTANIDVAGSQYSIEIKADKPSVQVGGDVTITVTARGGAFVGAACKLDYDGGKFTLKGSLPDGWEIRGENSYTYYNVINSGFYDEDKVLGTFTFTANEQDAEAVGTFSLTDNYIVDKWEDGWSEDDALRLADSSVDVTVTPASVYEVEIVDDYIAGYSLVLVYTNSATATYTYNGKAMYDVTSAGYRYGGTAYTHVYGLVTNDTDASAGKVAEGTTPVAGTLTYTLDVNGSDKIDLNDAVAVVAVYNANGLYMDAIHMDIVLKADVNGNKKVNVDDFGLIKTEYMQSIKE